METVSLDAGREGAEVGRGSQQVAGSLASGSWGGGAKGGWPLDQLPSICYLSLAYWVPSGSHYPGWDRSPELRVLSQSYYVLHWRRVRGAKGALTRREAGPP